MEQDRSSKNCFEGERPVEARVRAGRKWNPGTASRPGFLLSGGNLAYSVVAADLDIGFRANSFFVYSLAPVLRVAHRLTYGREHLLVARCSDACRISISNFVILNAHVRSPMSNN
jgi:hypothetical protein